MNQPTPTPTAPRWLKLGALASAIILGGTYVACQHQQEQKNATMHSSKSLRLVSGPQQYIQEPAISADELNRLILHSSKSAAVFDPNEYQTKNGPATQKPETEQSKEAFREIYSSKFGYVIDPKRPKNLDDSEEEDTSDQPEDAK